MCDSFGGIRKLKEFEVRNVLKNMFSLKFIC